MSSELPLFKKLGDVCLPPSLCPRQRNQNMLSSVNDDWTYLYNNMPRQLIDCDMLILQLQRLLQVVPQHSQISVDLSKPR